MGLLDALIPRGMREQLSKPNQMPQSGYKTFVEYSPMFSSWDGGLYEQLQTRAIIERIATACSKLKPEFVSPEGSNGSVPRLQRLVETWPNDMMTWPSFLKRLATYYYVDTTAFVVPGYDETGNVVSLWPLRPQHTDVLEYEGEPWIRFYLRNGDVQVFPFYDVVILARFQMDSDIFGGGNKPLTPTLRLMDAQRQAEEIALKNGADIRFIGRVSTLMQEEDMQRKRDRFAEDNFSMRNKSGMMIYDSTFSEVTQVKQQHYTIDESEMNRINKALFSYFGINEKILSNDYDENIWSSFYEGLIEPWGLMLGEEISATFLSRTQRNKGNRFMFTAGYLEYATPESKLKVVSNGMDRGIYTVNEGREVFNLEPIEGGDVRMIRGEYYMIDDKNNIVAESGGRTEHDVTGRPSNWDSTKEPDNPDEPDDNEDDIN